MMEKQLTKLVRKYGGSLVLVIDPEDIKVHNIKEGDILTLEIKNIKRT